jgi:hypothetical protein
MSATASKPVLHEDWAVVLLGFLIIAFTLLIVVVVPPSYGWKSGDELASQVLAPKNLAAIFNQFLLVFTVGFLAYYFTRQSLKNYLRTFPIIALLSFFALILAGNSKMKDLNLEAVIFSLTVGLLIGNLFDLPEWFKKALAAELLVKIGLVLLGTAVLWSDIQKAGSLGLIQALIVVITVWYFAFWLCRKFKLDAEFSMMLSSAVSICGVSAAIATAGAIKGDPKKLCDFARVGYGHSDDDLHAIPRTMVGSFPRGNRRVDWGNHRYHRRGYGCRNYRRRNRSTL